MVAQEQTVELIEYCSYQSKCADSVNRSSGIGKICRPLNKQDYDPTKLDDACILYKSSQQEQLVVSVQQNVFINEIEIYAPLNSKSIVKCEMFEQQRKKWWTMWTRKTTMDESISNEHVFKPMLRRFHLQTNTIRITIDLNCVDCVALRTIKILGSNTFETNHNSISLSNAMHKLYETTLLDKNCDVQFLADGKIISAHRNILCARSQYFRSLLLSDFREKTAVQPIPLTDVDGETLSEVFSFIYTANYYPDLSTDILVKCMIYCSKIDLISGKNCAIEYLSRLLNVESDTFISLYCLAKQYSPVFDSLLNYIYDLCSSNLSKFFNRDDFGQLDKDLMIDLICKATERREINEKEQTTNNTP